MGDVTLGVIPSTGVWGTTATADPTYDATTHGQDSPPYAPVATVNLIGDRKLENVNSEFTDVGATASWCWFNGPLVVDHVGTKNQRYAGWVAADGSVMVASRDQVTGAVVRFNLHSAFMVDDHAAPGILVRADGRIMVFYSKHAGSVVYYRLSTNVEDVSAFGVETAVNADLGSCYPKPIQVPSGRIYLFYRTSPQHRIMWSDDQGATWSGPYLWIANVGAGAAYLHINDDGAGRIDWVITHTDPSNAATDLYHAYMDSAGTIRKSDGTSIVAVTALTAATPNDYSQVQGLVPATSFTKVYDHATNGGAWGWDVARDSSGNLFTVFATFPSGFGTQDHRYNYGWWNGSAWATAQIVAAGHDIGSVDLGGGTVTSSDGYSAGIALDQADPSVVYLSRQVAPSNQFEIERWVTGDHGTTWASTPLTVESSEKQIRPMTPRHPTSGTPEVLWLAGIWYSYTDFASRVAMSPAPQRAQLRSALLNRPLGAGVTDTLITPALAVAPTILLPLAGHLLDASGNNPGTVAAVTPVYGAGRYGDRKALTFDGATQRLQTAYGAFTAGTVRTFFGWAKRTNSSAAHTLIAGSVRTANHYPLLRLESGNQNVKWFSDVANDAGTTWASAWPGNAVWAHWAVVFDDPADTVELWINGVLVSVQANTFAITANNALLIGARPDGSSWFNGSQALVGVYEGRPTAAQIEYLVSGMLWADCVLSAGVSIVAGYQSTLQAAVDANNIVHMRGVTTGSVSAGVSYATLPVGCRPFTKRRVNMTGSAGNEAADISTAGVISPATTNWSLTQGFDGVQFSL